MKISCIFLLLLSLAIVEGEIHAGGLYLKGTVGTSLSTLYNFVKSIRNIKLSGGPEYDYKTSNGNGRFVSKMGDGHVVAFYYHKTKKHYALCDGGFNGAMEYKYAAAAGYWAITYCTAGLWGRKSNYGEY